MIPGETVRAKGGFWRFGFLLLVIVLGAALLVLTVILVLPSVIESADRNYVQRMTGITWPEGASDFVLISDPTFLNPGFNEVHVRLPTDAIPGLLSRHPFRKLPDGVKDPLAFMHGLQLFPNLYTEIPRCANLYMLKGSEVEDSWFKILLDAQSGRMWIHVGFL